MNTNKLTLIESIDKYGNSEMYKDKLEESFVPVVGGRPSYGDGYYLIEEDGEILDAYWGDNSTDNRLYEIGNCFPTKEAAQFAIEKQKLITTMRNYAGRDGWKPDWEKDKNGEYKEAWYLYYDCDRRRIAPIYDTYINTGNIYFKSAADAQYIIDNYKDELLKYYFEVEG